MKETKELESALSSYSSQLESADSLTERLQVLVNVVGNVSVFSRLTGISISGVKRYLAGGEPTASMLLKISGAIGLNVQWLLTGEGPMRAGEAPRPLQAAPASAFEEEFALVPGYNIQVSAGHGTFPQSEQPTRHLAFRHKWLRYRGLKTKDLVLVFAKGDSMEPTISDNDTVMVDMSQRGLIDGALFVIRVNCHLVVKRVQTLMNRNIRLISDNKEYPLEELKPEELSDLEVIGRVVWIGKDV